ncbi:hypothetical protein CR513_16127, partial [Mucuna pruriens]
MKIYHNQGKCQKRHLSSDFENIECKATDKGGKYYDFWQNTRSVSQQYFIFSTIYLKPLICHLQLRNLVGQHQNILV